MKTYTFQSLLEISKQGEINDHFSSVDSYHAACKNCSDKPSLFKTLQELGYSVDFYGYVQYNDMYLTRIGTLSLRRNDKVYIYLYEHYKENPIATYKFLNSALYGWGFVDNT